MNGYKREALRRVDQAAERMTKALSLINLARNDLARIVGISTVYDELTQVESIVSTQLEVLHHCKESAELDSDAKEEFRKAIEDLKSTVFELKTMLEVRQLKRMEKQNGNG